MPTMVADMSVIVIKFGEDLPTRNQNKLRYRMELARWKAEWRDAESCGDYSKMDYLNSSYEMVGLP
jgi:hypothetical protein